MTDKNSPESGAVEAAPITFTDRARAVFRNGLTAAGQTMHRLGISANAITVAGFVAHVGIAWVVAQGQFFWGGVLLVVLAPLDALDGATARASNTVSPWGAFLDSTLDRYAEAVLLLGLLVYYMSTPAPDSTLNVVLVYAAFVGSIMVSYTRARAEAVNYKASIGVLSRLERYLVIIAALLIGRPNWGLWVIAVLANLTAIQRLWHVRKQYYASRTADRADVEE